MRASGFILVGLASWAAVAGAALAQTAGDAGGDGVSFNEVLLKLIDLALPIVGAVAVGIINHRIKNQQMATLLGNAVQNSIGLLQQRAKAHIQTANLTVAVQDPGMKAAIEYVERHASEALTHFGLKVDTQEERERLAEKIIARLGLSAVATNLADTASSRARVSGPLAPVPLGTVESR